MDTKISNLTLKATPVGADILPIVDSVGTVTKKITIATLPVSTDTQNALDLKLDILYGKTINPNNLGGANVVDKNILVTPLQNSPTDGYNFFNSFVNFDPTSTGFDISTSSNLNLANFSSTHQGTSDLGSMMVISSYSSIGNGTDALDVKGFSGIGIGANFQKVNMSGVVQGFTFNPTFDSTSNLTNGMTVFGDYSNVDTLVTGYQSMNLSPTVKEIPNNNGFASISINPTVHKLTGNAGYVGIGLGGTIGDVGIGTGAVQPLIINPTVSNNNYYNGIYSSTANVTGGSKWAGYFQGDVNITGNLSFGGALSIGALNAFATSVPVNGGGNPQSTHSLVSQMNIPANDVTANADWIGVNTAGLISVGANSNITLGALGLFSALALPAVIETHTGSVLPAVQGAVFALSLGGTSTGGTINQVQAGRFVAIPNGITTVNRFYGVHIEQPFGVVGTDNWGIYQTDSEKNYFGGATKIGGSDVPSVGSKLDVAGKTKTETLEISPVVLTMTGDTTATSNTITVADTTGIVVGQWVSDSLGAFQESNWSPFQIKSLYRVTNILSGTQFQTNYNASSTQTGTTLKFMANDWINIDLGSPESFFKVGHVDAFGRPGMQYLAPNNILKLGSWQVDGDPYNVASQGLVTYFNSFSGAPMDGNNANLMLFGQGQILMMNAEAGVYSNAFNVDVNGMYIQKADGTTVFNIDRATGNMQFTPSTPSDWAGNPTSIQEAINRLAAQLKIIGIVPIP